MPALPRGSRPHRARRAFRRTREPPAPTGNCTRPADGPVGRHALFRPRGDPAAAPWHHGLRLVLLPVPAQTARRVFQFCGARPATGPEKTGNPLLWLPDEWRVSPRAAAGVRRPPGQYSFLVAALSGGASRWVSRHFLGGVPLGA